MNLGNLLSKRIKESVILLLLVTVIAYAALYFINDGERLLPAKPTTQIYVQDYANLLSTSEEKKLEKSCENLYKNKGVKLVFLTVNSIPGSYTLDEYANEIFKKWKIGNEAAANSYLFIYDEKDKKTILEAPYGNDEDISNIETKLILLEAKSTILEGNAYKAFDTLVSEIAKRGNGISASNLTSGTDDSITAVSNNRADIIGSIFGFSLIIFLLVRIKLKSKRPHHNTHDKHTKTIPVAYRRNYYEDYGDQDHIFF